jgi:hypothetical protein
MKNVLLSLLLFTVAHTATSQRLKVYQNSDYYESSFYSPMSQRLITEGVYRFDRISLAWEFKPGKKKLLHQVELFVPQFESQTARIYYPMEQRYYATDYKHEATAFAFRYEVSKNLSDPTGKLNAYLGAGLNPYYTKLRAVPTSPSGAESYRQCFGAVVNAIALIDYKISKRFAVELSIPLKLYDFRTSHSQVSSPVVSIRQQTNTGSEHIFFERAYTVRAGLAYRFF